MILESKMTIQTYSYLKKALHAYSYLKNSMQAYSCLNSKEYPNILLTGMICRDAIFLCIYNNKIICQHAY